MIRLLDALLLLSPLLAFLALRRFGGPSPRLLAALAAWVLLLAAALWWFGGDRGAPPGSTYHPAQLHDGMITGGQITGPTMPARP